MDIDKAQLAFLCEFSVGNISLLQSEVQILPKVAHCFHIHISVIRLTYTLGQAKTSNVPPLRKWLRNTTTGRNSKITTVPPRPFSSRSGARPVFLKKCRPVSAGFSQQHRPKGSPQSAGRHIFLDSTPFSITLENQVPERVVTGLAPLPNGWRRIP